MFVMLFGCEETPIIAPGMTSAYAKRYGARVACRWTPPAWMETGTLEGPFLSPAQDAAADVAALQPAGRRVWWWDPNAPEAARFYGLMPLTLTGLFGAEFEVERAPGVQTCGGSVVYGPRVDSGYTITVEAIMVGETCCDVGYGFRALQQQMQGCGCGCGETTVRFVEHVVDTSCVGECRIPDAAPLPTGALDAWRTLRNVRLIEGPAIVDGEPGAGGSCGNCGCDAVTVVRFVLAADPGILHDQRQVVPSTQLQTRCEIKKCDETCTNSRLLTDPRCITGDRPRSRLTAKCGCAPLVSGRTHIDLGLGLAGFPRLFPVELEPRIYSGVKDMFDAEVRIWRKVGGLPAGHEFYRTCNMCAGFRVSFIPSGSTFTRSACTRRSTVTGPMGAVMDATSVVSSVGGGDCFRLPCGDYVASVFVDPKTASDATIAFDARTVWG